MDLSTPAASMENLSSALLIHKTVTHLYKNSSIREKQELVGSIFKNFLIYEGGEYRTAQHSVLTSLIFNDVKGFQESGIKKPHITVRLSFCSFALLNLNLRYERVNEVGPNLGFHLRFSC